MPITLSPEVLAFAKADVAAGRAASVEAWVEGAARAQKARLEALRSSLDAAEQEAQAAGLLSLDEALALVDRRLAAKR